MLTIHRLAWKGSRPLCTQIRVLKSSTSLHSQHLHRHASSTSSVSLYSTDVRTSNDTSESADTDTATIPEHAQHLYLAGRSAAGHRYNICLGKKGMQQIHRSTIGGPSSGAHEVTEREVFILGNACSEHLGYDKFNTLLEAHIGQQQRVLEQLKGQQFAPPLTNHTSIASPQELGPFLNALKPHLPWRSDAGDADDADDAEDREDWFVSLQTEGASAVWSATDIMLQLQLHDNEKNMQSENKTENENENGNERKNDGSKHIDNDNDEPDSRDSCANDLTLLQKHRIAVAEASYHGPGSSSLGSFKPFGHGAIPETESDAEFHERVYQDFKVFMETNGAEIGVILMEPQWGSSGKGTVWPEALIKRYISLAKQHGVKVVCDEIMCGLGRHGKGCMFLSEAWGLDPDAITFGKSICGGLEVFSGVVVKKGRKSMAELGRSTLQSHTYAGASSRALLLAAMVLDDLPSNYERIKELEAVCDSYMQRITQASNGVITAQGQGLLWGCHITPLRTADAQKRQVLLAALKEQCLDSGVQPYFVPDGFMVTPHYDATPEMLTMAMERLLTAVQQAVSAQR